MMMRGEHLPQGYCCHDDTACKSSNCNVCNHGIVDEERCSSISSLSPPPFCSSIEPSGQFSIDLDYDALDHSHFSAADDTSSDSDAIGSRSKSSFSRLPSSGEDNSGYVSRCHDQIVTEISRPGNPLPPSKSSSTATRSKQSSHSTTRSSSSSAPSLIQLLLRGSSKRQHRRADGTIIRPPSKIFIPSTDSKKCQQDILLKESSFQRDCLTSQNCTKTKHYRFDDYMSPLMLPPPSQYILFGSREYGALGLFQENQNWQIESGGGTMTARKKCHRVAYAAEYELCHFLRDEIVSLQGQYKDIQTTLQENNKKTKSSRSELIRFLAVCGGDSKDSSFVSAVETLEQLRGERIKLTCNLEEVTQVLKRRSDKLEKLCVLYSHSMQQSKLPMSIPLSLSQPPSSSAAPTLEGQWFTLTKPTYLNCLGFNEQGNPMYTLGRMSFEMFQPGNLVLSIEAVFNHIEEVDDGEQFSVPKTLQDQVGRILDGGKANEAGQEKASLRTYHIVTAFTIEPYAPSFGPSSPNSIAQKPIRGIMTTRGYALPDPDTEDRLSVWFSGGKMECGEPKGSPEFQVWKRIFGDHDDDDADRDMEDNVKGNGNQGHEKPKKHNKRKRKKAKRRRTFREGVMIVAAKLLMGATGYDDGMDEETGEMGYAFTRPVGGHGKAYVDVLHLDERNRVMRGHAGTLYVFARLGGGKKRS